MTTKVRPQQIIDGDIEYLNIDIKNLTAGFHFIDWSLPYSGRVESVLPFANSTQTFDVIIGDGGGHAVGSLTTIPGMGNILANATSTGNTPVTPTGPTDGTFVAGNRLVVNVDTVGPATELILRIKIKRTS